MIDLDLGLRIHIDNLETRRVIGPRQISTTPRNIAQLVSPSPESENILDTVTSPRDITRLLSPYPEMENILETATSKSSTPRDLTQLLSPYLESENILETATLTSSYIADPLRRTQKGKVNPLLATTKELG